MSAPDDQTPASPAPSDEVKMRLAEKLAHENDPNVTHWNVIFHDADFKKLLAAKARFIVPATIFFVIYYFTLPILVGYQPELVAKKVWGNVNVAYVFALSQFFMAWVLAFIYVGVAAGWDRQAAAVLAKFHKS